MRSHRNKIDLDKIEELMARYKRAIDLQNRVFKKLEVEVAATKREAEKQSKKSIVEVESNGPLPNLSLLWKRVAKGSMKAAIRLKCLDCSCFERSEVTKCVVQHCPLWPFRYNGKSVVVMPTAVSSSVP